MRKIILYILCLACVVCACSRKNKNTIDEAVSSTKDILLKVNGSYIFLLDEANMQYCTGARLFRAGNDEMSEYFSFSFNKYPSEEGESVEGDLCWRIAGATQDRKGLELTVAKIEDDVIWLSGDSGKINAVIRKN